MQTVLFSAMSPFAMIKQYFLWIIYKYILWSRQCDVLLTAEKVKIKVYVN